MKKLIIKKDEEKNYFPNVLFDNKKGRCEINGESFMESPDVFYSPLINWLLEFIEENTKPLEFIFKLRYYNTASSKFIVEILKILSIYKNKGYIVDIKWHIDNDDTDLEDDIEGFSIETDLPIEIIYA